MATERGSCAVYFVQDFLYEYNIQNVESKAKKVHIYGIRYIQVGTKCPRSSTNKPSDPGLDIELLPFQKILECIHMDT